MEGLVRVESMSIALRPGEPASSVTQDPDGYLVYLGKRAVQVSPEGTEDAWISACRATLRILDELLEAHRSPERAHGMYAGNDFTVAFATPPMATLLGARCPVSERLHDGGHDAQIGWRPGR